MDKNKLSCNALHHRSTIISLETHPLYTTGKYLGLLYPALRLVQKTLTFISTNQHCTVGSLLVFLFIIIFIFMLSTTLCLNTLLGGYNEFFFFFLVTNQERYDARRMESRIAFQTHLGNYP